MNASDISFVWQYENSRGYVRTQRQCKQIGVRSPPHVWSYLRLPQWPKALWEMYCFHNLEVKSPGGRLPISTPASPKPPCREGIMGHLLTVPSAPNWLSINTGKQESRQSKEQPGLRYSSANVKSLHVAVLEAEVQISVYQWQGRHRLHGCQDITRFVFFFCFF